MKLSVILIVSILFMLTSCMNRKNFAIRDADDMQVTVELKYSKKSTNSVLGSIIVNNETNSDICHCWEKYKLKIDGETISPHPYPSFMSDLLFCLTVPHKKEMKVDVEYHLPSKRVITNSSIEMTGKNYKPQNSQCDYSKWLQ